MQDLVNHFQDLVWTWQCTKEITIHIHAFNNWNYERLLKKIVHAISRDRHTLIPSHQTNWYCSLPWIHHLHALPVCEDDDPTSRTSYPSLNPPNMHSILSDL
ncbi:hypothetical protein Syun_019238 [Stephania yunnanensis]|uniref:Uncharacterized protein n=1 Tax=Stephania yunnanensis TaxID=152371 RepID=A0AAP0IW46_9MAGN